MSLAYALDFTEVEADPSMLDGATKDCPACDLDNPRAVAREGCKECEGTGKVGLAAAEIAKELRASRTEKPDRGASDNDDEGGGDTETFDEDLFLED
jgi:hypothetical protein